MIKNKFKKNSGFALLETLFYVIFLGILSVVVINSLIIMTKSFRETKRQTEIVQSSHIMERISREIKQANSISAISSSSLTLNTEDSSGTPKTIQFDLSNGNLRLIDNGAFLGNLNLPSITISNLSFTEITTSSGKGVKVSFSVTSNSDVLSRAYDFYNTVVLRGSY